MWNTPRDHISMMQIDCEVVDTRVVHLKDQNIQQPVANETTYSGHSPAASPAPQGEKPQYPSVAAAYIGEDTGRKIGYKYHPRNLTNAAVSSAAVSP